MTSIPFYTPELPEPYKLFDLADSVLDEGYALRAFESTAGLPGLFGPDYPSQIHRHLGEPLEITA